MGTALSERDFDLDLDFRVDFDEFSFSVVIVELASCLVILKLVAVLYKLCVFPSETTKTLLSSKIS